MLAFASMKASQKIAAIIMAGGEGIRFSPLSTPDDPKQFLNFVGSGSLLQQTFKRLLELIPANKVFVSTNVRYISKVAKQLPELPTENIIAEPLKKNTAPALIFSTSLIEKRLGKCTIISMPSDHFIRDDIGFTKILRKAVEVAGRGYIVTLGMKPDRPSVDYGYILPNTKKDGFSTVKTFHEKPDAATAQKYIEEGCLWNGGIFVWRSDVLKNEVGLHAKELLPKKAPIFDYFESTRSISIDHALLEKSKNVATIEADIGWSDIGTWESVAQLAKAGVDIAPRVKAVMNGDAEHPWRKIVPKPWGHEEIWAHTPKYVGKVLFIKKGCRLSLQYHNVKDETLRVLSGEMELDLDEGKSVKMNTADVFHVKPKMIHRMHAITDCLVMEVSTSELDDVVRLNDDFGRLNK